MSTFEASVIMSAVIIQAISIVILSLENERLKSELERVQDQE